MENTSQKSYFIRKTSCHISSGKLLHVESMSLCCRYYIMRPALERCDFWMCLSAFIPSMVFKLEISSCSCTSEHVVPSLGTFKRHKQHPCWRKSLAAGFESKGLSLLPVFPLCFQLSASCSCGHVCRLLAATLPQHDGLLHLMELNAKIMHFLYNFGHGILLHS